MTYLYYIISYHIISYHIILYYIILYYIYYIILYHDIILSPSRRSARSHSTRRPPCAPAPSRIRRRPPPPRAPCAGGAEPRGGAASARTWLGESLTKVCRGFVIKNLSDLIKLPGTRLRLGPLGRGWTSSRRRRRILYYIILYYIISSHYAVPEPTVRTLRFDPGAGTVGGGRLFGCQRHSSAARTGEGGEGCACVCSALTATLTAPGRGGGQCARGRTWPAAAVRAVRTGHRMAWTAVRPNRLSGPGRCRRDAGTDAPLAAPGRGAEPAAERNRRADSRRGDSESI